MEGDRHGPKIGDGASTHQEIHSKDAVDVPIDLDPVDAACEDDLAYPRGRRREQPPVGAITRRSQTVALGS